MTPAPEDSVSLREDLTAPSDCDVTPIHNFSSIQAHGALLAFTWPDQRIQIVSQNMKSFLNRAQSDVLGSKLDYVFDRAFVVAIETGIKRLSGHARGLHLEAKAQIENERFDAFLFASEGLYILELEKFKESFEPYETGRVNREVVLQDFTVAAKKANSIAELGKLICRSVRDVTGLDRVMIYRFAPPDWHGEVVAEDRITSAHSYLGHRFPATDIPVPARGLYMRNQVRLIANVHSDVVSLTPTLNPKTSRPLDMSDSRLRASAPIHIEYLKNMGVQASFSVAITEGERLWGLITCHHFNELLISQSQRTTCQIIADVCSSQVALIEQNARLSAQVEFDFKLKQIFGNMIRSESPRDEFFRQHRTVSEAFGVSGMALVDTSLKDFAGLTPLKRDIEVLASAVREQMDNESSSVWSTDCIADLDSKFEAIKDYASGVLAVRLPTHPNSVLMMLRPEVLREISWGGDPRKQLANRKFGGAVHPRESFETWTQEIRFRSKPWAKFEVDGLAFLRDVLREANERGPT